MKIGFDIRPLLSRETGVGVYFKNLLFSLAEIDKKNRYLLFSSSFKERIKNENIPPFSNFVLRDQRIPVKLLNYFWFRFSFPPLGYFFREALDITHSPNPLIVPGGRKKIATVHDLAFIDNPDLTAKEARKYFAKKIGRSLNISDGIISVSNFTKERILDIFGNHLENKIKTIYHGSDMESITSIKPNFIVPERFILFTGSLEPRKNLTTLIKAFSLLKKRDKNIKLVIAGKIDATSISILRFISMLKLDNEVIITGYLKRGEIKFLYENSILFVFPSLYEGFGLPVLEAASLGKPSIVSNIPVFKEIFKDYPIYFEKDSPEDLKDKIETVITKTDEYVKSGERGKKISEEFSWIGSAHQTLSFYKEING